MGWHPVPIADRIYQTIMPVRPLPEPSRPRRSSPSVLSHRPVAAPSIRLKHPWRRRMRYWYLRLVRLQGSSEAIARGLAAGAFAGMFPIFGFQILVGVVLATLVRGNRLAAAAATWLSNPFTYVPLFAFNFKVGQWLFPNPALNASQQDLLQLPTLLEFSTDVARTLFIGSFVMGSLVSSVSYFGGRWLVDHLRHRHRHRPRLRHRSRQRYWPQK